MSKKRIFIYILIIAALVGYRFRDKLPFYREKLAGITQSISQSGTVADIKREIFTSDPLRGRSDAPDAYLTVKGVIEWTNAQRSQNSQSSLKESETLNKAARLKLQDMFKNQYFEHVSPDQKGPADLAEEVHYQYIAIGENLALGNFENDQKLVEAWMNSPGHRANILNAKFTEIGVAVGKGMFEGKSTWMAVQEFGRPESACPTVNRVLKQQIDLYQSELEAMETQINQLKSEYESFKPKHKDDYEAYNQKVREYNLLVNSYNNKLDILKSLIAQYNNQVNQYNSCVAGAK